MNDHAQAVEAILERISELEPRPRTIRAAAVRAGDIVPGYGVVTRVQHRKKTVTLFWLDGPGIHNWCSFLDRHTPVEVIRG